MTGNAPDAVPRPSSYPPGFDEEDPYEDVDVSELPAWWRANLSVFEDHDMRPYRPPTFRDGELIPEVVARLERDLDVRIRLRKRLRGKGPTALAEATWETLVDGEVVAEFDRERNEEGRSVYGVASDVFERAVREAVD